MRLLWFVSDAIHLDALDAVLCDAHLSNDEKHHRRPQELLVPPTCDCIEMSIDTMDEMLLAARADEANTDYLLVHEERPKLALFDMDSTLIQQEVIDQLAAARGLGDQVSAITERAMRGELDFIESFTERLGLLSGLTESELDAVYQRLTLMPGAEILTANLSGALGCVWALYRVDSPFLPTKLAIVSAWISSYPIRSSVETAKSQAV